MKKFWTYIKHRRKDNSGAPSLKLNGKLYILLLKLEAYGLTKQSLNLLKNYLEEREQRVKVGGTCDNHISEMCKKASRQLNILKRIGKYMNRLGRLTFSPVFFIFL
jgi:hypothetical protein